MDYTNGLLSNEDRIAELEAQLENRKSFVRRAAELEGLLNEANKLIMEHCDQDDRIAALEQELAEFKNAIRKQHNGYLHPNDPVMGPEPESEFAAMMELFIEGKAFANSDRVIDMERELAGAKKDTTRNSDAWVEFRGAGFLWWVNRILHVFGWAINVVLENDGRISDAYPSRVAFTCFSADAEEDGVSKLRQYMTDNAAVLNAAIDTAKDGE